MGKMTHFVYKQIGKTKYTFTVEGDTLHDVVMEGKKLSFYDVYKCGLCQSDELYLSAHQTKDDGFQYTTVNCSKCKATLNFGQQKQNPEIFYLRTREATKEDGTTGKELDWKKHEPQNV